eukprot:CAMPEP_0113644246 /NCGR_PEP_ID=MMETSP0017_2-20120614/23282_1 /TAXON_ID=2856 /ORGANISM="Cylindrotheca closterium" /LENGTH=245 /DNA_ID=CAMNT_0000555837 /DNA_START=29 /DNA_END=766 /DNA_ORIENTATION=- /assembly_acc=CAM_ASM_000147
MKTTTLLTIATILGSQCYAADAADRKAPGKRRLGDPHYFSETPEANPEISDTSKSLSGKFANVLFGRQWGSRKMAYFGGDEFIQMYDDKSETRVVIRGYIDLQVDSIEGVFIFADREIHDVYGNVRGRAQGTCAHTSVGDPTYTCSMNLEVLANDGFVSAAFRSEGSLNFGLPVSQLTVTGGHTELESASGTMKMCPVSLDSSTDPATPRNVAGAHQFEYLFFEAVVYISSSFLANIFIDEDAQV